MDRYQPPTPRSGRRRLPELRVATVLVLVALVPLTGVGLASWTAVADARSIGQAVGEIEELSQQVADLAALDGAVFDETVWGYVAGVGTEIGAPAGLVESFIGADPSESQQAAGAVTDALMARVAGDDGVAEVADQLARARSDATDIYDMVLAYGDAERRVSGLLDAALEQLRTAANGAGAGDDLARATRQLELATQVRSSVVDSFGSYFSIRADVRGSPAAELAELMVTRHRQERALSELADQPGGAPAGLATIADSAALAEFNAALDGLIDASLATGLPPEAPPLTFAMIMSDIDGFLAVFGSGLDALDATGELIDGTVGAVLTGADVVRSDADAQMRRALVAATVLTLATGLAALAAVRSIVRPLRRLRRAADDLRTDTEPTDIVPAGPAEVRAATAAIGEAAAHFDLVTRQARALAAGDLNAEVLGDEVPGGLGTALQHSVGNLRTALARQEEFRRRLAHEASHDGLTRLPNRTASMAQLSRSLARTRRAGSCLAVLFVDLDRFKDVNDHHGHQAGDQVLATVAERLVNEVREGDHVGRLGGDEFVVVAEPVDGIDDALELGRRIVTEIERPIELTHVAVSVGASIGVAITGTAVLSADEMLRDADLAVYRAKELGRGGVEVCDEQLRAELTRSADLSVALRRAIELDELVLHYQPIVDTTTRRVRALEALVRWQRPGEERLVPPGDFIGFAERSSLIVDLDRWVVDRAARQLARWSGEATFPATPVAVNISRRHLNHHDVVRHVLEPLREHGVDPSRLIVEVTESAVLDNVADVAGKLNELRDAGVAVSIDDFGTGYTSLAHLRGLPVDILKIDRSFIASTTADPQAASVVKLIIDTGHLLGAVITAEGIETELEADVLADLGSDSLQGFYFARPQAPHDLLADLERSTARP